MVPSGEDCCSQRGNSTMEVGELPACKLQSCDAGFVCVCVCVCVVSKNREPFPPKAFDARSPRSLLVHGSKEKAYLLPLERFASLRSCFAKGRCPWCLFDHTQHTESCAYLTYWFWACRGRLQELSRGEWLHREADESLRHCSQNAVRG